MLVKIDGPVLLLMGPIGTFFSRLARFFIKNDVRVHKVMLPLHEFLIPKACKHYFNKPMSEWREYIIRLMTQHGITQVFMYGDFITPHKIAIEEAKKLGIEAYVFELGYIRPGYVTLEKNQVNARSNLNKPAKFYQALTEKPLTCKPRSYKWQWRKLFKIPTFIQHALSHYQIIDGDHKLQPKPSYLFCQILGYFRYYIYKYTERHERKKIKSLSSYFLVPLQVSIDSQISLSSQYSGMNDFIKEVMTSFVTHANAGDSLIFKHHPRDRGYNNYKQFITSLTKQLNLQDRVYYIHDTHTIRLYHNCKGFITINSSMGLSALKNSIPTMVMGETFYDMEGLTDQGPLNEFWHQQQAVNKAFFCKFNNYLIETTQIRGSFQGEFPFDDIFLITQETYNRQFSKVT